MKYFEVEIIETTRLMVAVRAKDSSQAREIAYDKYMGGELDMGFGKLEVESWTIREIDATESQYYSHEVLKKESDEDEIN